MIDGHHRTQAAVREGLGEVSVRIESVSPDEGAIMLQDVFNAMGQGR